MVKHTSEREREIGTTLKMFFSSVILGTTTGQLIVMDHHGNTTESYSLSTQSIEQLIYSCDKFYPDATDNSTIH